MKPAKSWLLGIGLLWVGSTAGAFAEVVEKPTDAVVDNEEGAAAVEEVNDGNPYGAIVVRNAFRLKAPVPPPPPPTNAPPPPEQPKVDVKLAGLAEIKGTRFAYLMVPDSDRPGQFQYPTLTDDPERGRVRHGSGLEVREINIKSQTVRLVNGGVEATINFKDNGVKNVPSAAAAKPGAPGQPGVAPRPTAPLGAPPTPGVGGSAAAGAPAAEAIVFSRNPNRASGGNAAAANNNNSGMPAMINGVPASVLAQPINGGASDVVVPTRPVRTTGGVTGNTSGVNAQPQITLEQEYQALIRQRQVADQQGIQLPPIPGVPMPTDPSPH